MDDILAQVTASNNGKADRLGTAEKLQDFLLQASTSDLTGGDGEELVKQLLTWCSNSNYKVSIQL